MFSSVVAGYNNEAVHASAAYAVALGGLNKVRSAYGIALGVYNYLSTDGVSGRFNQFAAGWYNQISYTCGYTSVFGGSNVATYYTYYASMSGWDNTTHYAYDALVVGANNGIGAHYGFNSFPPHGRTFASIVVGRFNGLGGVSNHNLVVGQRNHCNDSYNDAGGYIGDNLFVMGEYASISRSLVPGVHPSTGNTFVFGDSAFISNSSNVFVFGENHNVNRSSYVTSMGGQNNIQDSLDIFAQGRNIGVNDFAGTPSERVLAQGGNHTVRAVSSFVQGYRCRIALLPAGLVHRAFCQGEWAEAIRDDQKTWGSNRPAAAFGLAQSSKIIKHVQTADAVQTTLATLDLEQDKTYSIRVNLTARRTDADGDNASFVLAQALAYRDTAGAAVLAGSPVALTLVSIGASAAGWLADLASSGNNILLRVTGAAAPVVVEWCADIEFVEVAG
jgi:hypothetical protein